METFSYKSSIIGAVESKIGGRKENQDSYGTAETPSGMLVVVCDGMGGGPAGKTASMLATQAIIDYVSGAPVDKDPAAIMKEAGLAANEAVIAAVERDPTLRGMGTTTVSILFTGSKAYILHVGDSRCYQLRNGHYIFRTQDHSYVGDMVRLGQLTEEEARNSSYSNIITRAIGIGHELNVDVDTVDYEPGDRFALMSDGIWGSMPETQLIVLLSSSDSPSTLVEELCERVDNIGMEKGGKHDNLTLAVVDILAKDEPTNTAVGFSRETLNDSLSGKQQEMPPMPQVAPAPMAPPSMREGAPRNSSNGMEPRRRSPNRRGNGRILVLGLLVIVVAAVAFFIIYILFLGDIWGDGDSKKRAENEVPHTEQMVTPEDKRVEEINKDEEFKKILKSSPQNKYNESIDQALNKLDEIKDYNKEKTVTDRNKVMEYKGHLYQSVCNALQSADIACDNENRKKEIELILGQLNKTQYKNQILGTDRKGNQTTGEALDSIGSLQTRLKSLK